MAKENRSRKEKKKKYEKPHLNKYKKPHIVEADSGPTPATTACK